MSVGKSGVSVGKSGVNGGKSGVTETASSSYFSGGVKREQKKPLLENEKGQKTRLFVLA